MSQTCIIVPCYNEAARLPLEQFRQFLMQESAVSFLFINDGSSDSTLEILEKLQSDFPEQTEVLDLKQNQGKAEAVRLGVVKALNNRMFSHIGYLDADLATPLEEISRLDKVMYSRKAKAILGSRIKRLGANVGRKALRHYLGRIFATFASLTLQLPVYDTQCGAKLFAADLIREEFSEPFTSRWLFDVEILARLKNHYGAAFVMQYVWEEPLEFWAEKGGSKVKITHFFKAPFELWRIRQRYKNKKRITDEKSD